MAEKVCSCGSQLFRIKEMGDCFGCEFNPWYDEQKEKWVTEESDTTSIDDMVNGHGECLLGPCENNGCHLYTCSQCNNKTNLHLVS